MKKSEQIAINNEVLKALESFNKIESDLYEVNQLRSCSATVYEKGNYYVLKSYNTIVAIIDRQTDTLYDFLRYVYGYTSTSAQHISKFSKDYGYGKWGCENVKTYRDV